MRALAGGTSEPGEFTLAWDGRDERGHPVAPGLYFARLEVPGFTTTKRLVRTN